MPAHRLDGLAQQFGPDQTVRVNLGRAGLEGQETEAEQDQVAGHGQSGFRACEQDGFEPGGRTDEGYA